MKKKSLLIISTLFNYDDKRYQDKNYDILTLTINHHYYLKNNGINHLTIESFYDDAYQEKLSNIFFKKIREWLSKSDDAMLSKKNLNSAFSGNGFWFMHRLSDLFYIQYCINKITDKYQTIELITDEDIKNIEKFNFNFKDLSFGNIFNSKNNRLVNLISYALPDIKVLKVKGKDYSFFLLPNIIFSPHWIIDGVIRKFNLFKDSIYLRVNKKNKLFWKLQDGFELKEIELNAKNFKFINIKNKIISDLFISDSKLVIESNSDIEDLSKLFFREFLPSFDLLLNNLIQQYIKNGLSKIDHLIKNIDTKLVQQKPSGIILPMCAQDIFDFNLVVCANKLDIPVYFMKHNGPIEIFKRKDFLLEYLEQNKYLKRVQFIHSNLEKNNMKHIALADTKILRPLTANGIDKKIRNKNIKILYSFGSPSQYTLKDLQSITFDSEKINFLEELILNISNSNYDLHIKSHPRGKKELVNLFSQITKNSLNSSKIKFIHHTKIESLFNKYDLIMSDTLFSSVVSNALYTNKNIVVYCPRKECIDEKNYDLLSKRISLVHNVSEISVLFDKLQSNSFKYNIDYNFMNNISGDMSFNDAIDNIIKILDYN